MKYASKTDYRNYFANIVDYVRMSYFLKQVRIDKGNFSRFMKGSEFDYLISWDKLDSLFEVVNKKIT